MNINFDATKVRAAVKAYVQGGFENYGGFMDAYLALNEFERNVFISYLYILKTETQL